jgi:DNA-binding IclR family transcriptional regulator
VSQIAASLGLSKGTTHRLLQRPLKVE